MRDLSTDSDCRIVGTKEDLLALGMGSLRDLNVEGELHIIAIPAGLTPEQAIEFVRAANGKG